MYLNLLSTSTQKNNPQVHILPSKTTSSPNPKKRKTSFDNKIESFVINKYHIDLILFLIFCLIINL